MLWTKSRRLGKTLNLKTKSGPSSPMVGVQDSADQEDVFACPREETGRKRPDSEEEWGSKGARKGCSVPRDETTKSTIHVTEPTDGCARTGREAKS